jgi:UDP-GlcNAc:undecaprenyl-phosphate GlcNAc-1-phosphate transferase
MINNYLLFFLYTTPCIIILLNLKFISYKLKLVDYPKNIKDHDKPTSTAGGLIIYVGILTFVLADLFILKKINANYSILFIITVSIFFFLGIVDDAINLKPTTKTLIIIITLLFVLPFNESLIVKEIIFNNLIQKKIALGIFGIPITIFFIYLFYNAFNFTDGLNGVALSITIFWLITIIIKKNIGYNIETFLIILSILCILFNLSGKLFIGNSGSNLLCAILSLQLIFNYNTEKILFCDEIFILLMIPGVDMIRVIFLRIKEGKMPFNGDHKHLHHLLAKKVNKKYVWIFYLGISSFPYLISLTMINNLYVILISLLIYILAIIKTKNNL